MALVSHNNVNKEKKAQAKPHKLLDRGPRIEQEHQVTREDVLKAAQPEQVTYTTTIRTSNHVRNELFALGNLGLIGSSSNDIIKQLISSYIGALDESTVQHFESMVHILEQKDAMEHPKK